MAEVQSLLSENAFPEVGENLVPRVVERYLNNLLEEQMRDHLGAGRYERTGEARGNRSGMRERLLYTRVGLITLRAPQARDGGFSTDIVQRYQRSEQALVLVILEMYVNGVSTREMCAITESLCETSISKSDVRRLITQLDLSVAAFNVRRFDEATYPFVYVNAMFIKCRGKDRIDDQAALIASGVNAAGIREPLDVTIGDATAVLCLMEKNRKRLRSTNMQERLNEEIRRERVMRVFPNEESALRLIGALLAETAQTWQERRCLNMQEFREWRSERPEDSGSDPLLSVAS